MKKISIVILLFMVFSIHTFGETEERKIGSFSKVVLATSANAYVEQGNQLSVKLVGDASAIDKIITEVKGGKLIVRQKKREKNKDWYRNNGNLISEIKVYITSPEIEELFVAGSGNITVSNPLKSADMTLRIAGSGNIEIAGLTAALVDATIAGSGNIVSGSLVKSDDLDLNIAGSGNVVIAEIATGTVDLSIAGSGNTQLKKGEVKGAVEIEVAGSGDFLGKNLTINMAEIEVAGSGNCYVGEVHESLNVEIVDCGSVYYRGEPRIDIKSAGSGKVKKEQ